MKEFCTKGAVPIGSTTYIPRGADRETMEALRRGEFCYILTARQMGKTSLMAQLSVALARHGVHTVVLDLQGLGQNLNVEQWYNGLLERLGRRLNLEDELEDFWVSHHRLGPARRWFAALRDVALEKKPGQLVVFVDEIDFVRSLPFSTTEFFAAIRECFSRRMEDPELARLTFCLLGVATPAELIDDPRTTPFNIGCRIQLADFESADACPLAKRLGRPGDTDARKRALLHRVLYWTNGHPYLTQRLCKAVASVTQTCQGGALREPNELVDELCEALFFANPTRQEDDNLLYVRERIIRTEANLGGLLELYEQVLSGESVPNDESNDFTHQLHLAGLVCVKNRRLAVRNRIYRRVFDRQWIEKIKPLAELELPGRSRVRIKQSCSLGRTDTNDVCLPNPRVSRRHALIQKHGKTELWLVDRQSRNGTYLNRKRIGHDELLRDRDRIGIGPFELIFHQRNASRDELDGNTTLDRTVMDPSEDAGPT